MEKLELIPTNFGTDHHKITHDMIGRVIEMLTSQGVSVKTYGIDNDYYGGQQETIKIAIDEKREIQVSVWTKK